MKIEFFSKIKNGRQDGAVSNGFLFSFNHCGECSVYEINAMKCNKDDEATTFAEFVLDKSELIAPHSNSVMFGCEYYDQNDEFPLLYTNIYNNYGGCSDKLKGVCLVYRIQRNETKFTSTLVQMIEIGFVDDESLWKSAGEKDDVRPYGNFAIDKEKGVLYAFTMRDNTNTTRYFSFALPKVNEGQFCEKYGVKRVVLQKDDIIYYFDCPYHNYVQGACCNNGKIYSLEGFTNSIDYPPAIRVIDLSLKKEICSEHFMDAGVNIEPELIDFCDNICYYADHHGNMYKLDIC